MENEFPAVDVVEKKDVEKKEAVSNGPEKEEDNEKTEEVDSNANNEEENKVIYTYIALFKNILSFLSNQRLIKQINIWVKF